MEFSKAWQRGIKNRTSYKINKSSILIKLIMNHEFIQSEARVRDHQDELSGFSVAEEASARISRQLQLQK
jgi:hypothetical protein